MATQKPIRDRLLARRARFAGALTLGVIALATPALSATTGDNATHDPSRIVESDGRFYFCSTGGHCASSSDGLAWKAAGLRITLPSWVGDYLTGGNQGVWAPDIVFFEGKYYIYYSACGLPAADAACITGVYSTPTLDSASQSYKLTDVGKVLNNPHNDATYQFSTIDPGPVIDAAGDLWTTWGSGYGKDQSKTQLWVTRLDDTGLPLTSDPAYQPPTAPGNALQTGRKEGPYLHRRGDYYYLFYNTGSCCSGTASDYTIWVARSQNVTGPFTGDKIFYASNGDVHGPGHMGIYGACGVERFTYHYYPTATSILGENELSWNGDDWPVAGPPSTTALVPCGGSGGGGGNGAGGASRMGGLAGSSNGGISGGGAGGTTTGGQPAMDGTSGRSGAGGTALGGEAGRDDAGTGGSHTSAMAGSAPTGGNPSAAGAQGGSSGGAGFSGAGTSEGSPAASGSDSGCACSVGPSESSSTLAWLTTLGFSLGVGRSWRRRRKSSQHP